MHLNHYFLRALTDALRPQWRGLALLTAFSQSRDELILGLGSAECEQYVRISLDPVATFLSFPETFARARKNSVDLFTELYDQVVTDVVMHDQERSFHLAFADGQALMCKLYGNRANVVRFGADGRVAALFRHQLEKDWDLELPASGKRLAPTYEDFVAANGQWKTLFPAFGPLVGHYLRAQGYEAADLPGRWAMIEEVRRQLGDAPDE